MSFIHIRADELSVNQKLCKTNLLKRLNRSLEDVFSVFYFSLVSRDFLRVGLGSNVTFVFTEMNSISESFIKSLLCTCSLCKEFSSLYS